MTDPQASQNVSVEQNGRVLTGGPGTNIEALEQAIERTAPEPTQDAKPEPSADKPADSKPLTRGQARFSELTSQREAARQEAKAANDRAIALEARLKAIEERTAQGGTPEKPRSDAASSGVAPHTPHLVPAPSATREKPSEAEIGTKYATMGDYFEDLAEWKLEQREFKAEQLRAKIDRETNWRQRYEEAKKTRYPDFDEVLKSGPGGQVDVRQDYIDRLMDTPGGEHAVYNMAKSADVARRVDAMSEYEFGIFVHSLIPIEAAATPASTAPRATKAPPPYQPVQAGGKTTGMTSAEAASKGDYESYRRLRAAERGVKPKYK